MPGPVFPWESALRSLPHRGARCPFREGGGSVDWDPIEIAGEPELVGLEDGGLPAYRVPLSREPEAEWIRQLNVGRPHGIQPFEVRRDEVIVAPPPSRLRVYVQELH